MEVFEAIRKRASVREYLSKPVERELLEKLIDAGRRAPTARGLEPWEFIVIQRRENLKRLSEMISNGRFLADASACLAVFCQQSKYYLEDGCAATENILLAATALGLGACWVAGDKKPYAEEVARLLRVPEELRLVSLISIGWPKKEVLQRKSRALAEVIHWEEYRR
ncbi:MAG: nitroreductase family protein [Candidatus Omnitrophota bacterium]|nr:MAG: nitroreductase family protein [Candidatus Omnitrophota bacterium]